ncbi:hypothetical protein SteCoe_18370 [Stentor coeruleus]|uniref:Nucleosome assembly protein n=1 Tax=Stentor coeruleus TaxID=5963 RepID=A0A1R2BWP8_9CILI|nr:hypothetical protein SteCoe_18370 [Stentor coeruleus]
MENTKEGKDLEVQHKKAEDLLSRLSGDNLARASSLLDLQKARNILYMNFIKELKQLEEHYEDQYQPLYSQRAEILKTQKGFWLKTIKQNALTSSLVYTHDEEILQYLTDIKCLTDPDSDNFVLEFIFTENPFIENDILRKKYVMTNADVMEKSIGTEIVWKNRSGEDEEMRKKQLNDGSFFKFFNNINMPNAAELEGLNDSMEQELVDNVEQDFDIASEFKDEIIPNAVLYYLGSRCDDDKEE